MAYRRQAHRRPQTLSFRVPPGHKLAATRKLAEAAKRLAESRSHNITRDEVRAAVIGDTPDAPSGVPTFAEWVSTYLDQRAKSQEVQEDTLDRYAQILAKRAVPFLGGRYMVDNQPAGRAGASPVAGGPAR